MAELNQLAELLGVDRAQLAGILNTSLRTLQRKAESDARLGPAASDRLARIKRIHELATHVLGERDKASRWLTTASRGLGGQGPLQMLDTDTGTERVQQELCEIEYGMPHETVACHAEARAVTLVPERAFTFDGNLL